MDDRDRHYRGLWLLVLFLLIAWILRFIVWPTEIEIVALTVERVLSVADIVGTRRFSCGHFIMRQRLFV
jgi:hypothetical protein